MRLSNRVGWWPLWRLSVTSDSTNSRLVVTSSRAQNLLGKVDSALLASSLKGVTHFLASAWLFLLGYGGKASVGMFMDSLV